MGTSQPARTCGSFVSCTHQQIVLARSEQSPTLPSLQRKNRNTVDPIQKTIQSRTHAAKIADGIDYPRLQRGRVCNLQQWIHIVEVDLPELEDLCWRRMKEREIDAADGSAEDEIFFAVVCVLPFDV